MRNAGSAIVEAEDTYFRSTGRTALRFGKQGYGTEPCDLRISPHKGISMYIEREHSVRPSVAGEGH
jgi:hypothetical protein